jgi:hypothetical protein
LDRRLTVWSHNSVTPTAWVRSAYLRANEGRTVLVRTVRLWYLTLISPHLHKNPVLASQETSPTEPNRLMLFGEKVAVYCRSSKLLYDWRSVSLSSCRAPLWGPWPDFTFSFLL